MRKFWGLLQERFARRLPPDPEPEVPVSVLMARVHARVFSSDVLFDAPGVSTSVLRVDDVDWERIGGHLARAEQESIIRNALPRLEGTGRFSRFAMLLVARLMLLVIRGVTNQQGRFNRSVLAFSRGLTHRLQCCESVVVRQAEQIRALEAELAQLRRAA
jgi:hypothetical protein